MKVEIMYFGRPSEYLLMTSERMVIPDDISTLQQVLNRLRSRGDRWAYELDDSHVICTVDHRAAMLCDTLADGNEIGIFSSRSFLEM